MSNAKELQLIKLKLGISTDVRDTFLKSLLSAIKMEVENVLGIPFDSSREDHVHFVIDYAYHRYINRESTSIPRHLQWRMHNLALETKEDKHVE
ncbi:MULTISPECIES: phage head-tail connector protein [unclassified Streptococcus]|uniref:phage head-tail connector protein n=1 Tax=unclassified Streptococcus TaxID=2608887 RepID=UPI00211B1D8D|nr:MULTISPECIES: phage head-tail connector protein [unclassified Streptococcus]MCQ9211654.1 phage head-tail connector protein [Streptococcus sp. B01]MCQ9213171.1 phage head-tail connector protein [Streptococcus sp. O1]MCQ9215046.1 phage head-tail connector protein [Streptococcus sp. O1]MCQ9215095.1 phage head-tail connector protein [Streptococcus sp. O1]